MSQTTSTDDSAGTPRAYVPGRHGVRFPTWVLVALVIAVAVLASALLPD